MNRLLKTHRQMADMMKMMGNAGKRGPMAGLANMFGLGGGGMPNITPEMVEKLQGQLPPGSRPPDMPGLPPAGKGLPAAPPPGLAAPKGPVLPGLGSGPKLPGLPGLGGFNPFGKKK